MYRFLDKRFYRRSRLDFDLRTLACEHIGLSRSYAPTELKRRLKPALEELEQFGFLEPLKPENRYVYVSRGSWRITLVRGSSGATQCLQANEAGELSELLEALKARGVTAKTAHELVETYPADRISAKLDVFDWLIQNEDKRVGRNPAGYLVASIRSDYQAPGDYRPPSERSLRALDLIRPENQTARRKAEAEAQAQSGQARERNLRDDWEQLSPTDREAIISTVKSQNPGLSRWRNMLEPLCLAALESQLELNMKTASQALLFPDADGESR